MDTLLVYYHPVVFDLAQTFRELGHSVTIAVNTTIASHFGTGADILADVGTRFSSNIKSIPLKLAVLKIADFDLVGCDGVHDGDNLIMEACDKHNIPRFCIQGYPNVMDEPSDNILSLGWFTPTVQYHQRYPTEGHKKQIDWKNIAENRQEGKNICVFYPNFWDFKEKINVVEDVYIQTYGLISLVQGYEKWNKWSCELFKSLEKDYKIENLEGESPEVVLKRLQRSLGLIHLKWADQPGIAIFEAMLCGKPVYTLRSFVLASMNQEVLIDGYNAVVADSVEELKYQMTQEHKNSERLGENARNHAMMLTDFSRQRLKLLNFIEGCAR